MRVRLRRWPIRGLDEGHGTIEMPAPLTPASDGIIIHCTAVHPASQQGKKVELHIAGDEVLEVLAWMRAEAIRQRGETLMTPGER